MHASSLVHPELHLEHRLSTDIPSGLSTSPSYARIPSPRWAVRTWLGLFFKAEIDTCALAADAEDGGRRAVGRAGTAEFLHDLGQVQTHPGGARRVDQQCARFVGYSL